ncbi:hypothetical protein EMCRGX_G022727 [Ephydatia muelleri]
MWCLCDISDLILEGQVLQHQFQRAGFKTTTYHNKISRLFTKFMFQEKVKAALQLLHNELDSKGSMLPINARLPTGLTVHGVAALTANRLIGLDKCPGVRPIGVGEIVRRIISKAVLYVIKSDVLEAARSLQLCSGHETGCEAAIHSMCRIFHDAMTEAVLLVDADNAFNSLNRKVALLNIHQLCPSLATILTNTYRENASLFIDGDSFLSGRNNPESHGHTCYRNCSLDQEIAEHKYYAGLIVKPQHERDAAELFSGIGITSEGKRHLGTALGSQSFLESYISEKAKVWTSTIFNLSLVAKTQPHAAYSAFVHGVSGLWTLFVRTIPDISSLLQPFGMQSGSISFQDMTVSVILKGTFSLFQHDLVVLPYT